MPGVVKRQGTIDRALVLDPVARIRKLSEHGSSVAVDEDIPIKRYFRSGSEMERQARVYYTEGQLDKAFMLYNKFATLFIEKLPKHPEYAKAPAVDKSKTKKLLKQALPRAMELKQQLKARYDKERDEMERVIREEEEEEEERRVKSERVVVRTDSKTTDQSEQIATFFGGQGGVVTSSSAVTQGGMDPGLQPPQGLQSDVGMDPGLPPPQPDMGTRQQDSTEEYPTPSQSEPVTSYEATPTSQTSPMVVGGDQFTPVVLMDQSKLTATDDALAHVLPSPPYDPAPSAPPPATTPPLAAGLGMPMSYSQPGAQPGVHPLPPAQMAPQMQPSHPSLRQPTYEGSLFQAPFTPAAAQPHTLTTPPYSTPFPGYQYTQQQPQPPSPAHPGVGVAGGMSSEEEEEERSGQPVVDRSTKPESLKALNTGIGAGYGGMDGYRPVYIPADTASQFQEIASTNTNNNIETCGILAGKLSHNKLWVTHIIVPKQTGRADSCETLNEEELFDVQDQYDLITLGWIHTHPTQTAFLSSVDLHCHCSYQIMMDEAVAIVVAPKYQQVGYFMLTEPHGLNFITHCEEEGFHVHPKEPPLYEDCKHIHHDPSVFIQLVDLR